MAHDPDDIEEPPRLRRLRWLVTALTVVLILGVLAIAATIVMRLGLGLGGAGPIVAERFALPSGMEIIAVGRGEGIVLFVLRAPDGAETLRAFDDRTGEPAGASAITRDRDGG